MFFFPQKQATNTCQFLLHEHFLVPLCQLQFYRETHKHTSTRKNGEGKKGGQRDRDTERMG